MLCLTVYITDVGLHECFDDQANLKWHSEWVSDKSHISEQNVVVCTVPPNIMCDELRGLWPHGQGHTILNWEHLVCRFCCVHSSEVLWGGLYIFYIPKVLFMVEVKFEVCDPVWVRIEIRTLWRRVSCQIFSDLHILIYKYSCCSSGNQTMEV